jgi:anti-sigma factor RsiW
VSSLTCADVDGLLDAYLDNELPPATLLEVARHGEHCPQCQSQMQSLTSLGHMLGVTIRQDAATLDLTGVWAGVERRLDAAAPIAAPLSKPSGWQRVLRGPALPALGTAAAIAASAVLYLQPTLRVAQTDVVGGGVKPTIVVARIPRKPAEIQRVKVGKGGDFQVRRVPKDGTTAIWVSYSPDGIR